MKFRATLILLALAIGLSAFMILHTAQRIDPHSAPGGGIRIFARDIAPEELLNADRIEISHENIHLRFSRKPGQLWRVAYDTYDVPADNETMARILSTLGTMTALAVVEPPKGETLNLADYELNPETADTRYIQVGLEDKQWQIQLGAPTVDDKGVYVLCKDHPDGNVFVTPRILLDLAILDPWNYRNKAMIPGLSQAGLASAQELTVEVAEKPRVVCRFDEHWHLTEPVNDTADEDRVSRIITGLGALKFTRENFVDDMSDAPEKFGFDNPTVRIAIQSKDKNFALVIGNEDLEQPESFFAQSPGESAVFRLDARLVNALSLTASDIRSRQALTFSPVDVTAIAIDTRRRQVIRLARDGEKWTLTEPAGQTPDPSLVFSFLAELSELYVEDWIDEPMDDHILGLGLKHPTATVILSCANAPELRIDFGDEDAEGMLCHARINQSGPILLIPTALLRTILTGHVIFLPRQVLDFDPAEVAALVMTDENRSLRIERTESGWQSSSPEKGMIEDSRPQDLLWALCHLQSKRLVIENPSDVAALYGLQPSRVRINIYWKNAEKSPTTLLIGRKADVDQVYVMAPEENRVHVVSADILEKVSALIGTPEPEPAQTE